MATMNRINRLYSKRYESALEKTIESRVIFVRSYKTKQMREKVAFRGILN